MKLDIAVGVDYTIVNGTGTALTDVNAGGDDVPAKSVRDSITLTTTELAAVLTTAGVAVMKDAASHQGKRNAAHQLRYRKVVSL